MGIIGHEVRTDTVTNDLIGVGTDILAHAIYASPMGLTDIAAFAAVLVISQNIDACAAANHLTGFGTLIGTAAIGADFIIRASFAAFAAVIAIIEGIDALAVTSDLVAAIDFTRTPDASCSVCTSVITRAAMFVIFNDGYARIAAFHFVFIALTCLYFNTLAILANFILTACVIACAAMVCI